MKLNNIVLACWPFPLIRNYKTDASLTRLFALFAAQPDLDWIDRGDYYVTVDCSLGCLEFWSENRYFAWAKKGTWKPPSGKSVSWDGIMPSRGAVRAMRKRVSKAKADPNADFRAALQSLQGEAP